MDISNKQQRKTLIVMLERALKNTLAEPPKVKISDQQLRFQKYEMQKSIKQIEKPVQSRAPSKSDHVQFTQFYQRSQSQLEQRNERLQKSKEKLIQKRLEEEIKGVTFQPQINKRSSQMKKNDIYSSGMKFLHDKASNIENLKQSAEILKHSESNFKPIVNKVSEKILKESNQTNFYVRLSRNEAKRQSNLNKLKRENTPSFKPQINKSSQKLQSQLNKEMVQVSVDFGMLEKIKNYQTSQSMISQPDDGPSFRQSTVKKQPYFKMDSPDSSIAEKLYEVIMDDQYNDYYQQQ